jgi:hypothetical protein
LRSLKPGADLDRPRASPDRRESLSLLKEPSAVSGHGSAIECHIGAEAMSLHVLDAVTWILNIRGHIPQNGDFGPVPGESSFGANRGILIRVLAAFVVTVALLSLALWAAVWLAIKLL